MKLSEKALSIKVSETLRLATEVEKMKRDGLDVISFTAGEPDLATPNYIKEAAIEAINSDFTKYTDYAGIIELRSAIAQKLKKENNLEYDYSQIVVSNGSKHALNNVFAAILNPNDEVIVLAPYWNSYIEIVKLNGGTPVVVNTEKSHSFKVTKEQLENAFTSKTKAIIVNSPNNPTGMVYSKEELQIIGDFAVEKDIFIISDEIYEKLIYSKKLEHTSIASLSKDIYDRTIVVNGFSKTYCMTGWRVGYTASGREIANLIASIQSNSTSNVNSIAQKAALAAITIENECVENIMNEFKHRRDYIAQRISDIPFLSSLLPKGAFYLFVDVSKLFGLEFDGFKLVNSDDIAMALLKYYKVAVISGTNFGAPEYIRISFATSMSDIVEGVNRIEKFIKQNF